jgi:hypothetical protein
MTFHDDHDAEADLTQDTAEGEHLAATLAGLTREER